MDFNLSPEHLLIRKMMAEFTENEVKPIAAETDAKTLYPRENIEKLFDLGVMGMCIPKEYGGQGADPLASAICIEELSKQCASTGDIVATHNGPCWKTCCGISPAAPRSRRPNICPCCPPVTRSAPSL